MHKFLEIIKKDGMEGVSEPWCDNEGVAILPFVFQHNQYWFLLINEKNPLFENKLETKYGTLTGGCKKQQTVLKTVMDELVEETGIDITSLHKENIYAVGNYYANKTSIKLWHLYAIDISSLNLDLKETYLGLGDNTDYERGISGSFVNEKEFATVNDTLALAIYAKLCLNKIIIHPQIM
ncbi:hypothetical protein [Spiroplasma sp. AdecLV25b]|uniref:hypothetical protein n=1 Tax=Spiroplasma sp. AdecLV25b TaxID=3027162 RepID=UPI0027DFE2A7|nr:hypothetical protein [Spiroplasma sp. AdecLV25b]